MRRQKEKAQKQSLMRQLSQLQAKERRRTREIERDEAREAVRRLGTLVLDTLITEQDVGASSLVVDWSSMQAEQQKLIQRVVERGRAQGGAGAADLVADPAGPIPAESDIDIRLDGDAT